MMTEYGCNSAVLFCFPVRNMDRDLSPDIFRAFDQERAAAHGFYSLFDISQADMSVVALLGKLRIKAGAVIFHDNIIAVLCSCGADFDHSVLTDPDAVTDGVLHKRLYRQGRQHKVRSADRADSRDREAPW